MLLMNYYKDNTKNWTNESRSFTRYLSNKEQIYVYNSHKEIEALVGTFKTKFKEEILNVKATNSKLLETMNNIDSYTKRSIEATEFRFPLDEEEVYSSENIMYSFDRGLRGRIKEMEVLFSTAPFEKCIDKLETLTRNIGNISAYFFIFAMPERRDKDSIPTLNLSDGPVKLKEKIQSLVSEWNEEFELQLDVKPFESLARIQAIELFKEGMDVSPSISDKKYPQERTEIEETIWKSVPSDKHQHVKTLIKLAQNCGIQQLNDELINIERLLKLNFYFQPIDESYASYDLKIGDYMFPEQEVYCNGVFVDNNIDKESKIPEWIDDSPSLSFDLDYKQQVYNFSPQEEMKKLWKVYEEKSKAFINKQSQKETKLRNSFLAVFSQRKLNLLQTSIATEESNLKQLSEQLKTNREEINFKFPLDENAVFSAEPIMENFNSALAKRIDSTIREIKAASLSESMLKLQTFINDLKKITPNPSVSVYDTKPNVNLNQASIKLNRDIRTQVHDWNEKYGLQLQPKPFEALAKAYAKEKIMEEKGNIFPNTGLGASSDERLKVENEIINSSYIKDYEHIKSFMEEAKISGLHYLNNEQQDFQQFHETAKLLIADGLNEFSFTSKKFQTIDQQKITVIKPSQLNHQANKGKEVLHEMKI